MKLNLIIFLIFSILTSCEEKTEPLLEEGELNCSESYLKILQITKNTIGQENIEVSSLDYFYPLRLFAITDRIYAAQLLKSISSENRVDLFELTSSVTKLVKLRTSSILKTKTNEESFRIPDSRIFLSEGDYILVAAKGCKHESNLILDQNLNIKYIYTYASDIVLERDPEGRVSSSISFASGYDSKPYQFIFIDRYISSIYYLKKANPDTDLKVVDRWEFQQNQSFPVFRIDRDQTLEFRINKNKYTIFEIMNSPFYLNVDLLRIYHFHSKRETDRRRGIAFSFLLDQIEREKEL